MDYGNIEDRRKFLSEFLEDNEERKEQRKRNLQQKLNMQQGKSVELSAFAQEVMDAGNEERYEHVRRMSSKKKVRMSGNILQQIEMQIMGGNGKGSTSGGGNRSRIRSRKIPTIIPEKTMTFTALKDKTRTKSKSTHEMVPSGSVDQQVWQATSKVIDDLEFDDDTDMDIDEFVGDIADGLDIDDDDTGLSY